MRKYIQPQRKHSTTALLHNQETFPMMPSEHSETEEAGEEEEEKAAAAEVAGAEGAEGCRRLAAGLARPRGAGSPAEAARGGGEAGRRARCLAWRWLADLSIRGAAARSAPRGPRRGSAVTPRGSRGGRGHPTPAGARPLRRHKWSVLIQAGGLASKGLPGHLIHCFCSFLVAAHEFACKIFLLHFPVHFFGDEGVGSWEDKTSCPWRSGPIILLEMSSVRVVQTTAVSPGRLPYKVWA
ncbi:uncharacterized protein LOC118012665 [Mirounga leonina]|uniref:uncharacterized protein LOC118012665 n=1 Tax=Mirounga leonina TaxID=9715 RepID=UPI00156C13AE|nr:uncharacterized protein LOC118012665 [Mirounga leonina]